MKNAHPKRKLAIKMQTLLEKKSKLVAGNVFNSKAWTKRVAAIKTRVAKKSIKKPTSRAAK